LRRQGKQISYESRVALITERQWLAFTRRGVLHISISRELANAAQFSRLAKSSLERSWRRISSQRRRTARNVIVGFYQPAATVPTTPLFSGSESLQNAIAFLAIRRLEIATLRSGRSPWSTVFATVRSPASARMSHDLDPAAEWR
jgi:hypothetical protein